MSSTNRRFDNIVYCFSIFSLLMTKYFLFLLLFPLLMCDKLNIFIIPHSFNDPGWINTSDENYVKVFILNIVY